MVRQLTATQRNRKSRSCTTGLTVYLNRYGKSFNSLPLKLAGFLNALPYGIELELEDPQETIRGFIDTLVVQEQLWILAIESQQTSITAIISLYASHPKPSQQQIVFVRSQFIPKSNYLQQF